MEAQRMNVAAMEYPAYVVLHGEITDAQEHVPQLSHASLLHNLMAQAAMAPPRHRGSVGMPAAWEDHIPRELLTGRVRKWELKVEHTPSVTVLSPGKEMLQRCRR